MNYLRTYCNLIRKAQSREIPKGYTEKHHIFPKSIFGNNNRIVRLTAKEHYIAHALLEKACVRRYGDKHSYTIKMRHAFWRMNHFTNQNFYINSTLYETLRKRIADRVRERCVGKKLSPEHIENVRQTKLVYEYLIIDPNGVEYKTDSLRRFCEENNLHGGVMCYVVNGKRNHYKGWTGKILGRIEK